MADSDQTDSDLFSLFRTCIKADSALHDLLIRTMVFLQFIYIIAFFMDVIFDANHEFGHCFWRSDL